MVLLTLEQVVKIYGFTDKTQSQAHNRRTESVRRASRDVLILATLRPTSSSGVLALYDKMHKKEEDSM